MPIRNKQTDSPRLDRDDSLNIQVIAHPFSFKENLDNPANEMVVEAINLMGAVGPEAEASYQAALSRLREQAKDVTAIVAAELRALPTDRYLDRWSLVQLLAELRDPDSLLLLDEILSSRMPRERSRDPHSFSTVGEEVMIRTTAVEAVTRIASEGDTRALALLLKHAQHPNFSVKRAAIQGYLAHGGSNARDTLLETLSRRDQAMLEIRRVDVREVPQAEGGLFLVGRDTDQVPPRESPPPTAESK